MLTKPRCQIVLRIPENQKPRFYVLGKRTPKYNPGTPWLGKAVPVRGLWLENFRPAPLQDNRHHQTNVMCHIYSVSFAPGCFGLSYAGLLLVVSFLQQVRCGAHFLWGATACS